MCHKVASGEVTDGETVRYSSSKMAARFLNKRDGQSVRRFSFGFIT